MSDSSDAALFMRGKLTPEQAEELESFRAEADPVEEGVFWYGEISGSVIPGELRSWLRKAGVNYAWHGGTHYEWDAHVEIFDASTGASVTYKTAHASPGGGRSIHVPVVEITDKEFEQAKGWQSFLSKLERNPGIEIAALVSTPSV